MMKKGLYGICALAALLLTGCTADERAGGDQDLVPISLTSTVADMQSAAATTRTASASLQSTQLVAGQQFCAYFSGSTVQTSAVYEADGYGGTSIASASSQPYFTRTGTSTTVQAYHPATVTNTATSFSVQRDQSTDDGYAASDLMYGTGSVTKVFPISTGAVTFTHRLAKIIVNVTPGTGITGVTAVRIVGGYPTATLTAGTCEPTGSVSGTAFSTGDPLVMYSGDYTTVGTPLSCAALLPPQTVASGTAFLQVVTTGGTATFSLASAKIFSSANVYTYNITITLAAIGLTTAITDWTADGSTLLTNGNGTTLGERSSSAPAGAEAVDLGLSVKWANMNIGATTESGYGYYFQWGDPSDKSSSTCDWANYKWSNSDGTLLYKYVPTAQTSYWGGSDDPDNKLVLDLSDDAAYMNWGSNWRMPTQAELNELVGTKNFTAWGSDNQTKWYWEWTTVNSVNGYKIHYRADTSSESETSYIFLPAAGFRNGTSSLARGSYGLYLSSALSSSSPINAWRLDFGSTTAYVAYTSRNRCYGFSVRAVLDN